MDDWNPTVPHPIHSENRVEFHQWCTNGIPSNPIGTDRTIGTNGRPESHRTQADLLGK